MHIAARTNVRVTSAARRSYGEALVICFRGGAFSAVTPAPVRLHSPSAVLHAPPAAHENVALMRVFVIRPHRSVTHVTSLTSLPTCSEPHCARSMPRCIAYSRQPRADSGVLSARGAVRQVLNITLCVFGETLFFVGLRTHSRMQCSLQQAACAARGHGDRPSPSPNGSCSVLSRP
jgi:hypothetical protein